MKEKIKELLGLNIPANVVATAVGIDTSYISQLLGDEAFAAEVAQLRIANTAANAARDRKYDSIEDSLIARLEEMLEGPLLFTKPNEILSAIRIINAAKRRAAPAELGGASNAGNFLSLHLPENSEFAARFVVNGKNQVVEIAGRSISTMGAKAVVAKMEELQRNRAAPGTQVLEHKRDLDDATERLSGLVKLEHLPVADCL